MVVGTKSRSLLALLLAGLFMGLIVAPAGEAQITDIRNCNGEAPANHRAAGFWFDYNGRSRGACVGYAASYPGPVYRDVMETSGPSVDTEECDPEREGGTGFASGNFTGYVCLEQGQRFRPSEFDRCVDRRVPFHRCHYYSLTDCGPYAVDPTVAAMGFSTWFCVFIYVEDPQNATAPDVVVDPFFCPDQVDPTIFINGRMVFSICVDTRLGMPFPPQSIQNLLGAIVIGSPP